MLPPICPECEILEREVIAATVHLGNLNELWDCAANAKAAADLPAAEERRRAALAAYKAHRATHDA
jgi:hypothetical protein